MSQDRRNTSRENLSQNDWSDICALLPNDTYEIQSRLIRMQSQAANVPRASLNHYHTAVVCLHDAADTACWAHFALVEAYAHLRWHRVENCEKSRERMAIATAKFYVDNVPMRLYPAAEDVAESIMHLLQIARDSISRPKKKAVSSTAGKLGVYLNEMMPDHRITGILERLHRKKPWDKAMEYRNTWVHKQPPLCKGMGIGYKREDRWQLSDDLRLKSGRKVMSMGFGGGAESDWAIDDLLETMRCALYAFSTLLEELRSYFQNEMEEKGFSFDLR